MTAIERPLRRDAERNRGLILESARALFAQRGLTVSLDEIARHAGVGVGTVYRRFPSREQLIDALFEERLAQIVTLAQNALACGDAWLGFTRFVEGALECQAADKGLKELLLSTREGRDRITQFRTRMIPLATELVRRAQAAGSLRKDFSPQDIPLLQMMLGATVDAAEAIRPDLWRRYLALTLDGMRVDRPHEPLPVPPADLDELDCVMRSWTPPRRRLEDA
ncbi:MAG: TetR/AcrR family transcriptional regulator [Solirubrobacteraceae bacterium]